MTRHAARVATRAVSAVSTRGAHEYEARRPLACRPGVTCEARQVATCTLAEAGYYEQPLERSNVVCSSGLQAAFNALRKDNATFRKRFPQGSARLVPMSTKPEDHWYAGQV